MKLLYAEDEKSMAEAVTDILEYHIQPSAGYIKMLVFDYFYNISIAIKYLQHSTSLCSSETGKSKE